MSNEFISLMEFLYWVSQGRKFYPKDDTLRNNIGGVRLSGDIFVDDNDRRALVNLENYKLWVKS